MTNFSDQLRLKEMAEEDIYFARRDRELIKALHEEKLAERLQANEYEKLEKAKELQQEYAQARSKHRLDMQTLAEHYRKLVARALHLIGD